MIETVSPQQAKKDLETMGKSRNYAVNIMDYQAGFDEPLFVIATTKTEAEKLARQYIHRWGLDAKILWTLSRTQIEQIANGNDYFAVTHNGEISRLVMDNK